MELRLQLYESREIGFELFTIYSHIAYHNRYLALVLSHLRPYTSYRNTSRPGIAVKLVSQNLRIYEGENTPLVGGEQE